MIQIVKEGKAKIMAPVGEKISAKLPVFYNPVMKFNRDISILVLNAVSNKNMQIADIMAATGVRGIRFLLELKKDKVKTLFFNDTDTNFWKNLAENLKLNKIGKNKVSISNEDATLFMLKGTGFDYIDIDPFGSPNPFLDAAARKISREGILAVTATDTAALCGAFPAACKRKYWAVPLNSQLMYEFGLRILIRKVQLIGAQFDRALIPIFSYSKDHYMRVFFRAVKQKTAVDEIIKQHKIHEGAGPIWMGQLWDEALVKKMDSKDTEISKFLATIKEESKIDVVGYIDIHELCKKNNLAIPRKQDLIAKLRKKGYLAAETHFIGTAIRSNASHEELIKTIKEFIQ